MQKITVILCCLIFLAGCVGLVEKGGKVLDGSAFEEKVTARYRYSGAIGGISGFEVREIRNRAGEASIIIVMDQFPAVKLRGSMPDSTGNFRLTSLEYLGGNLSGWNEFTLELSAEGSFTHRPEGGPGVFTLNSPLETVEISAGKIRRSGSRLTGEEALTSIRNRYDRIQALVEWMKKKEGVPAYTTVNQKAFETYWQPLLLPEVIPRKKRNETWQEEAHRADAAWTWAEDVKWNNHYTETLLPEELRPLRNSGALLRDWEEAPGWIYFEYERDRLEGALQNEITMQLMK
jgi:hypothetical protein